MNKLKTAEILTHGAILAVRLKELQGRKARTKAILSAIHLKQVGTFETTLQNALVPFFKRQINSAVKNLHNLADRQKGFDLPPKIQEPHGHNISASDVFDPDKWYKPLVNICLPIIAHQTVSAMWAQQKSMGIDLANVRKAVRLAYKEPPFDQALIGGAPALPINFDGPIRHLQNQYCPACGARFERGDNGKCNRCGANWPLKSTASDWLRDHNQEDEAEKHFTSITFDTPVGPVTVGFALEMPQWMKDKTKELLEESFSQDYWKAINDTTETDIEDILTGGVADGASIRDMAQKIADQLGSGDYAMIRAKNIARTESGNALNGARVAAADDLISRFDQNELPMKKCWLSVLGTTTRKAHAHLDGVPADENGRWNLNGVLVRWPGDILLPPSDRCNCQCSIIVEFGMTDQEASGLRTDYVQRVATEEKDYWENHWELKGDGKYHWRGKRNLKFWKKSEYDYLKKSVTGTVKKEYSSTQFNISDGGYSRLQGSPLPKIEEMARKVSEDDLHEKGREELFHVTVLFGIHTEDEKTILQVVQGFGPCEVILGRTSVFRVDRAEDPFEVVKVEVMGDDIHRLHDLIASKVEYSTNFPDYKPHITLAYVKSDAGDKYAGWSDVEGMKLNFTTLTFSDKARNHTPLDLIGDQI